MQQLSRVAIETYEKHSLVTVVKLLNTVVKTTVLIDACSTYALRCYS